MRDRSLIHSFNKNVLTKPVRLGTQETDDIRLNGFAANSTDHLTFVDYSEGFQLIESEYELA